MQFARIHSLALIGLEPFAVDVEVDVNGSDKLSCVIVGLPDAAIREAKDRVLTSLKNSSFCFSNVACTVNLAPGNLRKEGVLYDLPIALGILVATGRISLAVSLSDYLIVGELGLSGETRPILGALAITMAAKSMGKKGIILPADNAREASAIHGMDVIPVKTLTEAVRFLTHPKEITPLGSHISPQLFSHVKPSVDFADIRGQHHIKRALEIAAAGGHNILLSGPPGSGKTMMARALIGIMPPLTVEEALECTKIHSIAGMLSSDQGVIVERPFRAPHHTVSYAGLIGGGTVPRPGEVSLAHNGILFLDELPEFSRSVLEVLRQPLEDRHVTISRSQGNFSFPTRFICIAAMNPCPCGMLGHPEKPCQDTQSQIQRYQGRISKPLLDRIDMHLAVPALRYQEMWQGSKGETSEIVRARVMMARTRQSRRFGGAKTNGEMSSREIKEQMPLDASCHELLRQLVDEIGVSARACDRILRVSRTIADLAQEPQVLSEHLLEAIAFRQN